MVAENMYVMGEIHLIQTNHGGGLGRKVPPKSRKITLDNGAQTWEIWMVGLAAPIARARAGGQPEFLGFDSTQIPKTHRHC